jgi:hypothetical protein
LEVVGMGDISIKAIEDNIIKFRGRETEIVIDG